VLVATEGYAWRVTMSEIRTHKNHFSHACGRRASCAALADAGQLLLLNPTLEAQATAPAKAGAA
jgi:hypothetical protein